MFNKDQVQANPFLKLSDEVKWPQNLGLSDLELVVEKVEEPEILWILSILIIPVVSQTWVQYRSKIVHLENGWKLTKNICWVLSFDLGPVWCVMFIDVYYYIDVYW